MKKKESANRLGSNTPVLHGLSSLFGGSSNDPATEVESERIQDITIASETQSGSRIPETIVTQDTPGTQSTAVTPETLGITHTPDVAVTPATVNVLKKEKTKKKPVAPLVDVAVGGGEFTPTRGLPSGWERHTYVIQTKHVELIEAAAYWDRTDKKDILRAALDAFFKGRKVKPLPQEKRRERKARATTKK